MTPLPPHIVAARTLRRQLADTMRLAMDRRLVEAVQVHDLGRVVDALTGGANPGVSLKEVDPFRARGQDVSLVTYASQCGRVPIVQILVEWGARLDAALGDHRTLPLQGALACGQDAVARLLLDAGADPRARSAQGESAIHLATIANSDAMVRLLLARDPSLVADVTTAHETALHLAASRHSVVLVQTLLTAGADPLHVNIAEYTALHAAVHFGDPRLRSPAATESPACLLALLDAGVSIAAADAVGHPSVLALAASSGAAACAVLLLQHGAVLTDPVLRAIEHPDTVRWSTREPVDPVLDALCAAFVDGRLSREAVSPLLHSERADIRERLFHLLCATPNDPRASTALPPAPSAGHAAAPRPR